MIKMRLTPRETDIPEIATLDSKLLEAYKKRIVSYNEKARKALDIFSDKKGDLVGSNCFAPIILREFFPKGTRLATMADLGRATEINPDFLKGFYSDTGLVLKTVGDSYKQNDILAKQLAHELRKRGMSLREGTQIPKIIYFDALDLEESQDSEYGLIYVLNEKAESGKNIIDAPELFKEFRFETMDENGIPVEDKNGNRDFCTRKEGLSRFGLDGSLYVSSGDRNLVHSSDYGKVVVVSGEAATQKLETYTPKDIAKAMEELKIPGLKENLLSKLRQ